MIEKEEWKPIKGYEDKYAISNFGRVKSLKPRYKDRDILKTSSDGFGYLRCDLSNPRKTVKIHRLVAEAFIPNPYNKPTVNHIDGDKTNNRVDNLEWNTVHENNLHANRMGLAGGVKHNKSKFTEEQVAFIKNVYKPYDKFLGARPLSRVFGVEETTIKRIASNVTYKYLRSDDILTK